MFRPGLHRAADTLPCLSTERDVGMRGGIFPFLLVYALASAEAGRAGPMPQPVIEADYFPVNKVEAKLGQLLFWDPILSGNRNISCSTCHHPRFGTSDGVSLSLGEGGVGLGPARHANPANMPERRVPRHSQTLFNLGAREFTVLFHDGRVEADPARKGGIRTPLEDDMAVGFTSILSAQTMFPVLSADEMAGHYGENDVSRAIRQGRLTGDDGAWDIIADRVAAIPAYQVRFEAVYPEIAAGRPIAFVDIANAIAAFIALEWRSDDSAFDAFLRSEEELTVQAAQGLELFYGKGGCDTCHAGPFQTDHAFHPMGQPQFGPGKAARFETHARDEGRMRVTGRMEDAYAFRTPSLRNVAVTAPYGHTGAFRDLQAFLRHHADPVNAGEFDRNQPVLPDLAGADDWRVLDDPIESMSIRNAAHHPGVSLSGSDFIALEAFLHSLTDPEALVGRLGIPETVPSGLPVER